MPAPRWFFRFLYDRESRAWERRRNEPEHRELVEQTADQLASVVAPPGPIADLGCGPGAHALALARRRYDVVGVDGSPRLGAGARARAQRAGRDGRRRAARGWRAGADAVAVGRGRYDVVGVDGSPRMVEVARARAQRDGLEVT